MSTKGASVELLVIAASFAYTKMPAWPVRTKCLCELMTFVQIINTMNIMMCSILTLEVQFSVQIDKLHKNASLLPLIIFLERVSPSSPLCVPKSDVFSSL